MLAARIMFVLQPEPVLIKEADSEWDPGFLRILHAVKRLYRACTNDLREEYFKAARHQVYQNPLTPSSIEDAFCNPFPRLGYGFAACGSQVLRLGLLTMLLLRRACLWYWRMCD